MTLSRPKVWWIALAVAATGSVAVGSATATPIFAAGSHGRATAVCASGVAHDINGDGYADAVVGANDGLHIVYGQSTGPDPGGAIDDQWVTTQEPMAVAIGDVNGDGCADVVYSTDYLTSDDENSHVYVLPGTPTGVDSSAPIDLPVTDFGDERVEDAYGYSLTVGDFNGDGVADIATGDPFTGAVASAGAVFEWLGHAGSAPTAHRVWTQGPGQAPGTPEAGDGFGWSVASGDFTGDGRDDLAVGVMLEDIGTVRDAGAVDVLDGSATGLTGAASTVWTQNSAGISGTSEKKDHFGQALTVGDLNGDGRPDLAVGVPGESIGSAHGAGMINVIYAAAHGLSAGGNQGWSQASNGIAGTAEEEDLLGFAITTGDFNGDGRDDLAAAAPSESIGSTLNAGMVTVINGGTHGLTATGSVGWTRNSAGVPGGLHVGDNLGTPIAAVPTGASSSLLIGLPDTNTDDGAVFILRPSRHGLLASGVVGWYDDGTQIHGAAPGQFFGRTLS